MSHFHDIYFTTYRMLVRLLSCVFISEGRPWKEWLKFQLSVVW